MQKYFFTLLIVCFGCRVIAQRTIPDFGKTNTDELKMSACSFEAKASALILFDVEEVEFENSYYDSKLKTERRVRLKIFNEKGYKYASIKIPYFSKKGVSKIKDLKGAVYNLNESGKIITQKLEKKDFFKTKTENNVTEIDFTFPNLRPGSVIEFSYTKIEKNIIQIDPWTFQDEIPTLYSAVSITTPQESRLKEKVFGEDTVQQVTDKISGGRIRKTFFKENIPSFQYEPFMSSFRDNLLRVIFLLIPSSNAFIDRLTSPETVWKYAGSSLLESKFFGGQIEKMIPGTEGLVDSAKKIANVSERIKFIYDSVRKRVPNEVEQTLDVDDLTEAWDNKNGNSTEINLILLNLLKKANVPCCPLLVSTRNHGKINTDFPSTAQFNGIDVLAVDSNRVFPLDASVKWQSYQNPPFNILNRSGFMLVKENMQWVEITDNRPLVKQKITVTANITNEGKIEGSLSSNYYDYAKTFVLDSVNEKEYKDQFVHHQKDGLRIISKKQIFPENDLDPLEERIEFAFEPQQTDSFYFINPEFFSLGTSNPFLSDTRNTDIDFGCNQQLSLTMLLYLPPSYQVESLPKNLTVRAPDSSFFFQRYTSSNNSLISLTQTFEIKRSVFSKEEYVAVQEFFKTVYALRAEDIVLKKK